MSSGIYTKEQIAGNLLRYHQYYGYCFKCIYYIRQQLTIINMSKRKSQKKESRSRSKSKDSNLKGGAKSKAANQAVNYNWTWKQEGSLIYGDCGTTPSTKIASFDMDDTLIKVKSNAKFAQDANDWVYWHETKITDKLKELSSQGYKIVIFTNQNGITLGKTSASAIKTKIENFSADVGVKIHAFIASADDEYRKPSVQMWDMLEKNNGGVKIDLANSFFCGDAAGRKKPVKDFSNTDLLFAKNVGVPFKTPEVCFLGQKEVDLKLQGCYHGSSVPTTGSIFIDEKADSVKPVEKQMIIFCGSPGAGKSTFWNNYLKAHYSRVNRDTLKTKQKCYAVAEDQIKKGKSVVIDNTNAKKSDRAYFIGLAKKHNYKVRCFFFDSDKQLCLHNDAIRATTNKRAHLSEKAGKIPIHTWFKNMEEPQLAEGFYEIKKVAFVAKFEGDADQKAYQSITKGK